VYVVQGEGLGRGWGWSAKTREPIKVNHILESSFLDPETS